MIRVALYLIAVGLVAYGVVLIADHPGDVVITWQGWRIETSLMVLGGAVLAAMVLLMLLWSLVRAVLRSPFMVNTLLHNRRGLRAYEVISRGLIAVGAGDLGAARKLAAEVKRIAPAEPLALLLSAQSAQLAGDPDAADKAFRVMASRPDTKALGLHGLYVEAQRRDDVVSARAYAEEAARTSPSIGWAGKAVLEMRCATGDWAGALTLLERSRRVLDKEVYRRQRAVMLTARALAAEETDHDGARQFAVEAARLAPTLVPAVALAGRLLAEGGEPRRATRIIEKAWRANPHPDLAAVYSDLHFGDAARDRLKRQEALAKKAPGHVEAALALAAAAIDAREFAKARAALAPFLSAPTKRTAVLMARLERTEHGNEGGAREWIARALNATPDPEWTADGYVSDRWLPVSPVSGRLDAFEWRVPLAVVSRAPMIEWEPATSAPVAATVAPPEQQRVSPLAAPQSVSAEAGAPVDGATPAPRRSRRARPTKPEPVIPLVHAPDDPGPDAVGESEPRAEPPAGGWRKIFE
jgi:HemY protein